MRGRLELFLPGVLVAAFVVVAVIDVAAFPYHEWDALSYGEWSRLIAKHWRLNFPQITDQTYQRPLLYVLQGVTWGAFGFSERLGRAVDLVFGLTLLAALFELGRRIASRTVGAVAVALALLVPTVQSGIASGLTDVPAAAVVALAGLVAVAASPALIVVTSCLCVLTKTSTLPALVGLALAWLVGPASELRRRLRRTILPIGVGVGLALIYDGYQSTRLHEGLVAFLRAGSTGYYATLSAQMRRGAVFGFDWLGGALRPLLLYALAYAVCRAAAAAHRRSAVVALVVAAALSYLGPLVATRFSHAGVGPFDDWRHALGYLGLLATFVASIGASADRTQSTVLFRRLLLWSGPPLIAWAWSGAYDLRLLSPAWPPLILLCALALSAAFDGATGRLWPLAIPAVAVVSIAAAAGLENVDGIGRADWQQAQNSTTGLFDLRANRQILLPQFEDVLAAVTPVVGARGALFSSDGKFRFFFPGRVTQSYPRSCGSLRGHKAFVLLTDDASANYMESQLHVSADPARWAACRHPKLTLLLQAGTLTAFRVG